jgi:GNAT superfamily N-acetyltransferase
VNVTRLAPGPELEAHCARVGAVTSAVSRELLGTADLVWLPGEIRADITHPVPGVDRRWLLLTEGSQDVAGIEFEANSQTGGPPDCELWLPLGTDPELVVPRFLAIGNQFAAELGRQTWCAWYFHADLPARVSSPEGIGSVGRDRVAELLISHGARLGQVYRISALDLVEDPVPVPVPSGYRVEQWLGPTPSAWLPQAAELHTITMADAPTGQTGYVPEQFSVERVAADEAAAVVAGRELVSVLVLTDEGRPAALTQVAVQGGHDLAYQWDTVVAPEHRGRRLGRLCKTMAAELVRSHHPRVRRMVTFNAAENAHMLRINEELGWRPIAHQGVWVVPTQPGFRCPGPD